jgi:release factor glutamine methyltransferase
MPAAGQTARRPAGGMGRRDAVAWGAARLRGAGLEPRDAWVDAALLLRHAAGLSREELLMRPEAAMGEEAAERFAQMIGRRAAGCPPAYLTGRREFGGLAFDVDQRVLIPRPETEVLVDAVADALAGIPSPVVVDVGTGSGAIALTLAHRLPGARVIATDVSTDALAVARRNAARLGLADRVTWALGDALEPLAGRVPGVLGRGADAVCANPPYVPSAEMDGLAREIRDYEPRLALDGGPDGLAVHRRIAAGAAALVRPGGVLAVETSALGGQARAVAALVAASGGFAAAEVLRDYAGLERVVIARRRGRP